MKAVNEDLSKHLFTTCGTKIRIIAYTKPVFITNNQLFSVSKIKSSQKNFIIARWSE